MTNKTTCKAMCRGSRILSRAAVLLLMGILLWLLVLSIKTLALLGLDGPFEDSIRFLPENILANTLLTAAAIAAILTVKALLERVGGMKLSAGMLALWAGAALVWVLAVGLISETDFGCVVDSSERFAQGDYELLHWGYFRGSSFQLGICLVIDTVKRLLPLLDVDVVMQCLNVFASIGFMGLLAAFAEDVFGVKSWVTALLYVLYMPAFLYNHYVYGTLPMLFFGALACFCFARYLRTYRTELLLMMMIALAVSYVLKPNGLVAVVALTICTVLHVLQTRDAKPVFFALGAFVLCFALKRLVVWQYELRAGFPVEENQSILTWLVMGITPAEGVTPGWYTGYVGMYYDMYLPKDEQLAMVLVDLNKRLAEITADPGSAVMYFKEKILSQWMEPTCSVMSYGLRCEYGGKFNGLAIAFFREGIINDLALAYMNIYQQMLYVFACIGVGSLFVRRKNAAAMALPVIVIGGFMFHTLMEAKSQYIYPYMVYMMPLCALGLERISSLMKRKSA